MATIYLRNPEALRNPKLVKLFKDAIESIPGAAPGGFESCAEEVFAYVTDRNYAAVAGVVDGEFTTLCVTWFPLSQVFPYPHVVFFYNAPKAGAAIKHEVMTRMLDIITDRGYTVFHTANWSGHADAAWEKAFASQEYTLRPRGMSYEFRVN